MQPESNPLPENPESAQPVAPEAIVQEIAGPEGLEPTRYGDWEKQGRCIDF